MGETYTAPPLRADPAGDVQPSDFHRGFNVIITLSNTSPALPSAWREFSNLLYASFRVYAKHMKGRFIFFITKVNSEN